MIAFPSGTLLVNKVDQFNNFKEDALDYSDMASILDPNVVTITGNQTVSGTKSFTNRIYAQGGVTCTGSLIISGSIVLQSPTSTFITGSTVDGSDTQSLVLNPGGASTSDRGSVLILRANESAMGIPGQATLLAGNTVSGYASLRTEGAQPAIIATSGIDRLTATPSGQLIVTTSGMDFSANQPAVLIRGIGNFTRFGIEGATPVFQGWHFNGTLDSKTIVTSGNFLSIFQGGGWNGRDFAPATGRMVVRADDNWIAGTSYPTRLDFDTTATGATSVTSKWRMDGPGHFFPLFSGTLNLGSPQFPVANLYVDNLVYPGAGGGNFVTTTGGNQTVSGIKTFANELIASGITLTGSNSTIFLNTTDGSDSKALFLSGGGALATTRGPGISLYGNENVVGSGLLQLFCGNVTNGKLQLATGGTQPIIFTTSGVDRASITAAGSLVITTAGNGLAAGDGILQVRGDENNTRITIEGTTPVFQGGSYGGNLTSKSTVTNGANLGILQFGGFDGTSQVYSAARLAGIVDGSSWTTGSKPTKLVFSTTPSGSATLRTVWEMKQNGALVPGSSNSFDLAATDLHIASAYINNIFNDLSNNALDLTSRSGGGISFNTDTGSSTTVRWTMSAGTTDLVSNGAATIRPNTADAADNASMTILGGGDVGPTRGATLYLGGNEDGTGGKILLSPGGGSGATLNLGGGNIGSGAPVRFLMLGVEKGRFDTGGNFLVGVTSASCHTFKRPVTEGNQILIIDGNTAGCTQFFNVDNVAYNSNAAAIRCGRDTPTSRSINAAGTINASGADYAEYMYKALDCGVIEKGDVVGVTESGTLTDKWSHAISFCVKSTNPAYVGADDWGTAEYLEANELTLEESRAQVDRIAFAGRAPVNLDSGYSIGDYIVAQSGTEDSITAIAVSKEDKHLYAGYIVGRVWATHSGSQPYCNILFD